MHTTHTVQQTAFIFSICTKLHGLHENGMQTATVTDMADSENPRALHVPPHDKVKVWHTEWAQNPTVHIFSKEQ